MNLVRLQQDIGCQYEGTSTVCLLCKQQFIPMPFGEIRRCAARALPDYLPDRQREYFEKQVHVGAKDLAKHGQRAVLLGDLTEHALSRMGITKEWYKDIKERYGFMPDCWCEARKEWLNNVHQYWITKLKKKPSAIRKMLKQVADKGKALLWGPG